MGPVAISAAVVLIIAAPLMRGGNRQVAMIGLEAIAVFFLLSVYIRSVIGSRMRTHAVAPDSWTRRLLIAFLLSSPAWLAIVYLAPVPMAFWNALPGHAVYGQLLAGAGLPVGGNLPTSLVPDATKASLLAGIPLVAGFLAGSICRLPQLRLILGAVAAMAFLQVLLGMLQAAGGGQSSLYFDVEFGGRPLGTFANTNHFANYVGMALAAYIWLAWNSLVHRDRGWSDNASVRFGERHALSFWIAGGLFLVLGILMTRSRGATLSVLPAAVLAGGVALLSGGRAQSMRTTLLLLAGVLVAAVSFVGVGTLLSRFDVSRLAVDASFRSLLASSTLLGAGEFWPWGAGWGSYASVYPRFQPVAVDGYAEYAHHDYAQMLFEGGVFAIALIAAFVLLASGRLLLLARSASSKKTLTADQMASVLCGLGLSGFLLHSLVEFNMHIPANAIQAALLAGAFLRPLPANEAIDD